MKKKARPKRKETEKQALSKKRKNQKTIDVPSHEVEIQKKVLKLVKDPINGYAVFKVNAMDDTSAKKLKMIKDPVHGYIKIQADYVKNLIDTEAFQRLRNIRQTSYDSLFPGSSHNRFIHSLGVYHLGAKAFRALNQHVDEKAVHWKTKIKKKDWMRYQCTFEIACLLHDVGHTPFSHTGEGFLLKDREADAFEIMIKRSKNDYVKGYVLYNELLHTMKSKLTSSQFDIFRLDFAETLKESRYYKKGLEAAKPHEIMSVIIAMETYNTFLLKKEIDFDLFARMIIGLRYKDASKIHIGVKNALIQMLNSSIIDVDRLDYIMRDMQMSGFDSTSIDIERLLKSVTLIKDETKYLFGYEKNALSTIENVVLAHDAERRWIQGHPIVMYESFLLKKCIEAVQSKFKVSNNKRSLFQKKSLTANGVNLDNGLTLRLMNDGDLLFLMKQIRSEKDYNGYVIEYLSREKRKRPIWKSEAEFRLLLNQFTKEQKAIFMETFTKADNETEDRSVGDILNDKTLTQMKDQLKEIKETKNIDQEEKNNKVKIFEKRIFWLEELKSYLKENKIEFMIHNHESAVFHSKVNQLDGIGIKIWYGQFNKADDISSSLKLYQTNEVEKEPIRLFYLYIDKDKSFDVKEFIKFLKSTLESYEKKFT